MADRSICVPIQKRPVSKQILLMVFNMWLTSVEGINKEFNATANIKNRMKIGNPNLSLFSLKYQAENKTKGTIHQVLPNFKVAATSTALSPISEAAPMTEAVS